MNRGELDSANQMPPSDTAINFCLSIVMDTTGSMCSAINSVKESIENLLRELESIQLQSGGTGSIVGQVIQYKDYSERSETDNNCSITSDFSQLRRRLEDYCADGGGDGSLCGSFCEDMQYGVKCALANMTQSQYKDYYHMMIIIGDYPCHGDDPNERCYNATNPREGRKINDLWSDYFSQMKSFEHLQVWFMPISPGEIRLTYNRFNSNLRDVHITEDTSGDQLKTIFDDTITQVYRTLIEGTTKRHSPLCSNKHTNYSSTSRCGYTRCGRCDCPCPPRSSPVSRTARGPPPSCSPVTARSSRC